MPLLRKKFTKGSAVVEETEMGHVRMYLAHGSYPLPHVPSEGLTIEPADVRDLADCLSSLASSPGGLVCITATGVIAEWIEV